MAQYRFLSTWIFEAPIESVWERLDDPVRWPEWWRGVEQTEILGQDHWRSTWRSFLPYTLTFDFEIDRRERPYLLGGRASGELAGTGVWRLFEARGQTASTWDWRVGTTAPWMNALGPIARPTFAWNHGWVMRRGAEGLARDLGCALVVASQRVAIFLLMLRQSGADWKKGKPLEEQSDWAAHASFMDRLVDDGFIILGGPLTDDGRVAHVVEAESEQAVRATLARDPWSESHLSVDSIEPWTIRLVSDTLRNLVRAGV